MSFSYQFTKEQIQEAIENSDFTYISVANYLARHFSAKGKCDNETAKRYIQKYNLEAELQGGELDITTLAYGNIRKAIKKGDIKTSKWWLERIMRQKFGNEITVHNENKDPLNINFENFNVKELLDSDSEIGGLN
jgi:hypothetical protein